MIEWIEEEVGVGKPVGVGFVAQMKMGHQYRGRLLVDSACGFVNSMLIEQFLNLNFGNVVVVKSDESKSLDLLTGGWTVRRDHPHSATQCLIWIQGNYLWNDAQVDLSIMSAPGARVVDFWDQTSGDLLFQSVAGEEHSLPPSPLELPFPPPLPLPSPFPAGSAGLPFPIPSAPGVDPGIMQQAIDAVMQAAAACPQLATIDGPLQRALALFVIFAAEGIEISLPVLLEELTRMCPNWRSKAPGSPPTSPPPQLPLDQPGIADLLAQLLAVLNSGTLSQLPGLAQEATSIGLPALAQEILTHAAKRNVPVTEETPPGPPAPPPPPGPPPPPPPPSDSGPSKKRSSGAIIVAVAVIGIGLAVALGRS